MMDSTNVSPTEIFDVLGCGFGPANLGIAVALAEKRSTEQAKYVQRAIFVEKHPDFQWHPGMLLPGAKMQISCLKDLATLRDPTSYFTFLSYLHSQNRLPEFINRGTIIPSRREFADYLGWTAQEVVRRGVDVAYGEEVIGISKVLLDEQSLLEVTSRKLSSGETIVRWTKNIILSPGGRPRFPSAIARLDAAKTEQGARIIHTSSYMNAVAPLLARLNAKQAAIRIAVIGGGQSSAECLIDLYRRLEASPNRGHQIDMIIHRGSLKPSDDSPFVNEIFDPKVTHEWYNTSSERTRLSILSEYKNTNYSVVNPVTLDALYDLLYDQKLSDSIATRSESADTTPRVHVNFRTYSTVINAVDSLTDDPKHEGRIRLTLHQKHTLQLTDEEYDAAICGTGYDRSAWLRLLRSSNLAEDYGLAHLPSDIPVKLIPEHDSNASISAVRAEALFGLEQDSETDSAPSAGTTSLGTSPPLSPRLSEPPKEVLGPAFVQISRTYQLIPRMPSPNRIYLQGCAEATHGISDTLLSVIAVRSGEVVDDIWKFLSN